MWYWVFDLNLPLLLLLNGSSVWVWVMCWIANPGHSVWAIRHIFTNKSNQKPLSIDDAAGVQTTVVQSLRAPETTRAWILFFFLFCFVCWFCLFLFVTRNFFFKCQTLQRVLAQTLNALQSTAWGQIQASMGKLQSWQGFDLDVLVSYCSFIFALHKLHGHICLTTCSAIPAIFCTLQTSCKVCILYSANFRSTALTANCLVLHH